MSRYCVTSLINTRVQRNNENIDQYVTELRRLAKDCAYGDLIEEMIRDRIVCGTSDARVKEKLLQAETLDLPKAINIARGIEISTHQMKDLAEESDKTVHAMNKSGRRWQKLNNAKSKTRQEEDSKSTGLCSYCGRTKHVGKQACPAKGKVCFKCNKLNHYSRMCKSKTVHEVEVPDDLNCEDGDFFIGVVNDVNQGKDEISVNLLIEDSNTIKVKLDTGVQVNVMPVQVYNSINTNKSKVLQPTKVKLTAYGGNNIPVIGSCQLKCKYKTDAHNLQFYVVDANAPTALGLKACQALSLIKVVMTVDKPDEMTKIHEQIEEFSDVFSGQGCLSQEYDIQVKSDIKPVVHAARKLPVSMKEKVKKELDRVEKLKIIRRVDEPTDWAHLIEPTDWAHLIEPTD